MYSGEAGWLLRSRTGYFGEQLPKQTEGNRKWVSSKVRGLASSMDAVKTRSLCIKTLRQELCGFHGKQRGRNHWNYKKP